MRELGAAVQVGVEIKERWEHTGDDWRTGIMLVLMNE